MTIVDTMEAYDPFYSKTWTRMPSMPLALAGHCMLQYRDSLVVVGGTSTAERESDRILSFNITFYTAYLIKRNCRVILRSS